MLALELHWTRPNGPLAWLHLRVFSDVPFALLVVYKVCWKTSFLVVVPTGQVEGDIEKPCNVAVPVFW